MEESPDFGCINWSWKLKREAKKCERKKREVARANELWQLKKRAVCKNTVEAFGVHDSRVSMKRWCTVLPDDDASCFFFDIQCLRSSPQLGLLDGAVNERTNFMSTGLTMSKPARNNEKRKTWNKEGSEVEVRHTNTWPEQRKNVFVCRLVGC